VQGAYEPLLQQKPQQGRALNVPTTSEGNGDEGSDGGLLMMISMDIQNFTVCLTDVRKKVSLVRES
jgi:hypothetical protein